MTIYSYLRVSSKRQDEAMQREAIRAKGVTIDPSCEYVDHDVSGTTMAQDRAAYAALMSVIKEGDTIYVYALDRIGRNTRDILDSIEHLNNLGITLVLLKEGIITEGLMGKFITTVIAAICQLERDTIVQRVRDGMKKDSTKKKLLERPSSVNKQRVIEAIKYLHNTQGKLSINKTREGLALVGIDQSRATIAEYISTIYSN